MNIKIKILPHGKKPTRAHMDDAGLDFYAPKHELIAPHSTKTIMSGVCMELPSGYYGDIRPRSSMFKRGINTAGTIDEGYRGEIGIMLQNSTDHWFEINEGERIAQMVVVKYWRRALIEVEEISNTERGEGGFGSSGK